MFVDEDGGRSLHNDLAKFFHQKGEEIDESRENFFELSPLSHRSTFIPNKIDLEHSCFGVPDLFHLE